MPETRNGITQAVELYQLSEILSIIPVYDGNPIFLNTFISYCGIVQNMAVDDQITLLVLYIKNKLREHAAKLVNSRNSST